MLHLLLFSADNDCSESFSTGALLFCFAFMSKLTCRDDYQTLSTPRPPEKNANRKYQGQRHIVAQMLPAEQQNDTLCPFYGSFLSG